MGVCVEDKEREWGCGRRGRKWGGGGGVARNTDCLFFSLNYEHFKNAFVLNRSSRQEIKIVAKMANLLIFL